MLPDLFAQHADTFTEVWYQTFMILGVTSYIWVPLFLLALFWRLWMRYIRSLFIHEQGSVLLELRLPREVYRSPKAMEIVLTSMFQKGEPDNLAQTFWDGKVPPWFSLEMVSLGGAVHFYIWTWPKFKDLIESHLYSQYPGIEVIEVEEDYASKIPLHSSQYQMWGGQFTLTNPDPYPILTYVDIGLDKSAKEEEKIDPIAAILEFLGSLRKGEQAWLQIMIQAHKKEGLKLGRLIPKPDWKDRIKKEIQKVRESVRIPPKEEGQAPQTLPLVENEQELVKAMQRSLEKFPFDCVIRGAYVATHDAFDPARIGGLISTLRQVSTNDRNGFKPNWKTDFSHPWEDFRKKRQRRKERRFLDAYRRRSFFHVPYRYFQQPPFVLTTEELATLFHVPGEVAATPTLQRVTSRKGEAPTNLPSE